MLSDLGKLQFFLMVLAFQKIKTVFTHHWLFSCFKLLLCWRFSRWSAYRQNHGQVRGLMFSYSVWEERHHSCLLLLAVTFDLRPLPTSSQLSQPRSTEGNWSRATVLGRTQPASRWWAAGATLGTAPNSWQPQGRNSSGGRGSSSLASQLPSNLHTKNPDLQLQGGHNPSSLTSCRDWSSLGISETPLQLSETTCTNKKNICTDGSRPRELLSRHILHVSCGPRAS